ncbi:VLRF1 family aeRF1-type release factor [Exiguobacterium sp. SL14]|nr:VLRF1 family aeRF1-type release factor [Exiguobacterium sp. SL14]MCY1691203.1 VLRF1 family aeRF1-type release factor [Exiguobacterium sp. SL14]
MGFQEDISRLKQYSGEPVLSVYLSTAPDKRNQWQTVLRNERKRILSEHENQSEIENCFDAVERAIQEHRTRLLRSVVTFFTSDGQLKELHLLQVDVTDEISYGPKANVNQLEVLDHQFPRTGIVLTHLDSATILDVRVGEIETRQDYELDLDTGQWRRYQGRSARQGASSSSQSDDFQARVNQQAERFYRDLASEIDTLRQTQDWERLILIGERSQASYLEQALKAKPDQVIHKNLSQASNQQLLQHVF